MDFEASFVEIDFHNGRARLDRVGQVPQSLQQVGQYIIRNNGDELEDQQCLMQRRDTRHRIWFESSAMYEFQHLNRVISTER